MGINIGAFTATLLCGWLGETFGWSYGFGAAGIGMLVGLITFSWGQKFLHGIAEPHDPDALRARVLPGLSRETLIYLGAFVSLAAVWWLLQRSPVVHTLLVSLSVILLLGLAWFLKGCTPVERQRMVVLIVLIFSTVVFWSLFEQASASMTLFADRVVDREVLGMQLSASQFGAFNSLFIMLLAPVFAWLWIKLAARGLEPSTPVKFGLGIMQAGLGFGVLVFGSQFPDATGHVALLWLALAYLLHTTGELCLSPVGLSAVTKLSVPRVVGLMMGAWFLATAYSENLAAQISKIAAIESAPGESVAIATQLATYTDLFGLLFWIGLGMGVVMIIISPLLRRGMHGVN
jgi:POT family proton-dependent oligopeptide transporter